MENKAKNNQTEIITSNPENTPTESTEKECAVAGFDETEFQKTANRVSVITIIGNLLLSVIKLIAGFVAHSNAMISDAIHSASDVYGLCLLALCPKGGAVAGRPEAALGHHRRCGGHRPDRIFQIRGTDLRYLRAGAGIRTENRSSHWHFFLHLPASDLCGGCVPGRGSGPEKLLERAAVRGAVPSVHRRPHCPL